MERKGRNTMNDTVGTNIRTIRERLSWTQLQLAEAADISERTVQRAEEGKGMSSETLQAIAGALNVTVEALRHDERDLFAKVLGVGRDEVSDELIESKVREVTDRYMVVNLKIVEASADFGDVFNASAVHFNCIPTDDATQDAAAELKGYLVDLMDVGRDASPTNAREFMKGAFEIVSRLRDLKRHVTIGLHGHRMRLSSGDSLPWRTLYVIVSSEDEPKKVAMIEKGVEVDFA